MKKIYLILFAAVCILSFGCSFEDDGGNIFLEIEDALIFENNQNYVVGDTLYVELNFSRYLDEAGFSNKLDVLESSGSEDFHYDFSVNKFSELSNGFTRIDISPEFLFAEKGTVGVFGPTTATAQLNSAKTQYESRIGLVLVETGSFELDLRFLRIRSNVFSEDRVQIEIQHRFMGIPPNFEFEVTE